MLQKLALTAASAVAALTLALALAAAGVAPGSQAVTPNSQASPIAADPAAADAAAPDAMPTVQVDTIYLKPAPKQKTITVHKVVKSSGGENEHESGGDD
jgi:hypothetical protein